MHAFLSEILRYRFCENKQMCANTAIFWLCAL